MQKNSHPRGDEFGTQFTQNNTSDKMASASDRRIAEGLEHLRLGDKWYI